MDFVTLFGLLVEGFLSFLSPCILPLVPLYVSYLTQTVNPEELKKSKIMMLTNCFVLGICTVFFIMALGISAVRVFIQSYQAWISMAGGIILVVFGLVNLFGSGRIFNKTFRITNKRHSNIYLNAYLVGFFFSFAWTPCIGPYLSNVIIQASATSFMIGNLSILFYALGFVIPFLLIGMFTEFTLKLIKNNMKIIKWTTKIGAVVLIVMGLWMAYDGYKKIERHVPQESVGDKIVGYDYTLSDQDGNIVEASDYFGKKTIYQFMTSWCKYCKESIVVLENFASKNDEYSVVLVMAPGYIDEMSKEDLIVYIEEQGYELTVILDENFEMFGYYGVNSFPTTFYIDEDGFVLGYSSGLLNYEQLLSIIEGL